PETTSSTPGRLSKLLSTHQKQPPATIAVSVFAAAGSAASNRIKESSSFAISRTSRRTLPEASDGAHLATHLSVIGRHPATDRASGQKSRQTHRHAEVPGNLELAEHHPGHRIQLARKELPEVLLGNRQRAVRGAVLCRCGAVCQHDHPRRAAIEFESSGEAPGLQRLADAGGNGF